MKVIAGAVLGWIVGTYLGVWIMSHNPNKVCRSSGGVAQVTSVFNLPENTICRDGFYSKRSEYVEGHAEAMRS